jgi:hypothetical protein
LSKTAKLTIDDMHNLAKSKGWRFLSKQYINISTKHVWKCANVHHPPFEAMPNDVRHKDSNCPYCTNRSVCFVNCLAYVNPVLADEWHPTKNGDLTPWDIVPGYGTKVWWQCSLNPEHEWETRPIDRLTRGCRQCWEKSKTSMPEQAIYYYLKKIFPKTENKFLHPNLDNKQEIDIFVPEINLAIEYDGFPFHEKPKEIQKDEKKNEKLKELGIPLIRVRSEGLPDINFYDAHVLTHYYGNRYYNSLDNNILEIFDFIKEQFTNILSFELLNKMNELTPDFQKDRFAIRNEFLIAAKSNNLSITHPEIAKLWHPTENGSLKPEHFTYGSNESVFWLCENGHTTELSIKQKCKVKAKCVTCQSLGFLFPEIAKLWHPTRNGDLTPMDVYSKGNTQKYWWKGKCKHEWEEINELMIKLKTNLCPFCSKRKINSDNNVAALYPDFVKLWHPDNGQNTLDKFLPQDKIELKWYCDKYPNEHVFMQRIDLKIKGSGCHYCSGHKWHSSNSFGNVHKEHLKEWHYGLNKLSPHDFSASDVRPVWWQCPNDKRHVYKMSPYDKARGRKCSYCGNNKVLPVESFGALYYDLAKTWHPDNNKNIFLVSPNSRIEYKWYCSDCDFSWKEIPRKRAKSKRLRPCYGK